jgi:pimeloyl-ACP methyl ester carboxylesterase
MPSPVWSDQGRGPVVVLVHGVGAGPGSFAALAAAMATDHRVLVVERPTGEGGIALNLNEQADRLIEALEDLEGPLDTWCLVGVSGGATLGLAIAIAHPGRIGRFVLHEPLVGRHVPELHEQFTRSAAIAAQGDAEAMDVVRAVMGERSWDALGPEERAWALVRAPRWRAEIAAFAGFAPTGVDLAGARAAPVLTTVGAHSDRARLATAEVLERFAGASVATVPGAGNLVQVDAPHEMASILRAWRPVATGARP